MLARARVVAEASSSSRGGSRCVELRSSPPLTFRETPQGLYLVGSSAGPIGGDDLRLDVRVGAGATLTVRSVAASMLLPGPHDTPSRLMIDVEIAAGGALHWLPEPTIVVRGCDHRVTATVRLGAGAALVWREEVVLGRHEEPGGSLFQRLVIDLEESDQSAFGPLIRNDLAVGPAWPGSLGPAGIDGAAATGTLVWAGAAVPDDDEFARAVARTEQGVRLAVMPADGPALLVAAVATRPGALVRAFDAFAGPLTVARSLWPSDEGWSMEETHT